MKKVELLDEKSIVFLEKYLNNASPTGYEWEGQKIWMDYLKPYVDEFITDTYGTAVGIINPKAKFKVVIEGHADEISWYVNYITDDGLIYVIRNGGSDHQIAASKRVNIHTKKGIVKGVFGWPAIHTRDKEKEQPPKMDNICIDVGCSNKDEVLELGVHLLHFDLLVSLFVEPVSPRGLVNWHTIVIANLKDSLSLLYTLSFSIDAGCG
jgi:endoglucanase